MTKNTKTYVTSFGKVIPDFIDDVQKQLIECKNVSYQYLSNQLKGMFEVAKEEGLQVVLVIRKGTTMSKNVLEAIGDSGAKVVEVSAETLEALSKTMGSTIDGIPMIVPTDVMNKVLEQQTGAIS